MTKNDQQLGIYSIILIFQADNNGIEFSRRIVTKQSLLIKENSPDFCCITNPRRACVWLISACCRSRSWHIL